MKRPILIVLAALSITGCGGFNLNYGYPTGNDAAPNGTVVAQGQFFGANGKTVSGTAVIYSTGFGIYVLRLESLSAPQEASLLVTLHTSSETAYSSSLSAYSGNKNYAVNLAENKTFTSVKITSALVAAPGNVYGNALMSTP